MSRLKTVVVGGVVGTAMFASIALAQDVTPVPRIVARVPPPFAGQAAGMELGVGSLSCKVDTVEGIESPYAYIDARVAGMAGFPAEGLYQYGNLGTGPGMFDKCPARAATAAAGLREHSCVVSAIDHTSYTGGNFTSQQWSFSFVCALPRDGLVMALGDLFAQVVISQP